MITSQLKNTLKRSPLRYGLFLIPLTLAWVALSPTVRAVDPPPDGGYPNNNTAEGDSALFNLATGTDNTAIGFQALYNNTDGGFNTATGRFALFNNTFGSLNTAIGADALSSNTYGGSNTAIGQGSLRYNTTGEFNTATGVSSLLVNTTGSDNTANGLSALQGNTTGHSNTAMGVAALVDNGTGNLNTATGASSLLLNTTGSENTAIGEEALLFNTTGGGNIALGAFAGGNLTTGNNNIDIGNDAVAGESNTIRIGTQKTQTRTFVAGINGTGVTGVAVKVNAAGQLGVPPSSARFKQEIQSMDKTSDVLLALRPVTFRYKPEIDPEGVPQFGLVAEEVEKVNPHLVVRDAEGKVFTVRYEAVNAMLLNEFLKAHRKIEDQQATIAELKSTVAQQQKGLQTVTARLEEQAAEIQKVSAQLESSKPVPQVVNNP